MKLTKEYRKRTEQALAETIEKLKTEKSYMEKFQDKDRIDFLEKHIKKLLNWLEKGSIDES